MTLPTADARGRFTAYVYRQLGVSDLIADNVSHYGDLALRAAKDQRLHDRLRPRLRERMKMTMLENSAALRAWESFMMRAATLAGSVCASGE